MLTRKIVKEQNLNWIIQKMWSWFEKFLPKFEMQALLTLKDTTFKKSYKLFESIDLSLHFFLSIMNVSFEPNTMLTLALKLNSYIQLAFGGLTNPLLTPQA